MEQKNCLGIYLGKGRATAVLISAQAGDYKVSNCFSVAAEADDEQGPQSLGRLIGQACRQRELTFTDVAVAIDCTMFTQHSLQSEFTDQKQVAQTVKFDAEEAFAIDASDLAVTFNIAEVSDSGSQLNVFAAQKKLLGDILLGLQANNFDPVTIEPDVTALARFTCAVVGSSQDTNPLFAILSQHACYLIGPAGPQANPTARTFLVTSSQNKVELLTRQIRLTIASAQHAEPINCLKLADATGSVDYQLLTETLGIQIEPVDLAGTIDTDEALLADCSDRTGLAIAYGAALGWLTKAAAPDFRTDFAPYQGRKVLVEKALKVLSIYLTILVLTIGLYFQLRLLTRNRQRAEQRGNLQEQYAAVMNGQAMPVNFLRKLTSELGRVKAGTSAMRTGEQSVPELLTFTLEALNKAPSGIDLKIDSISVSPKSIVIIGKTRSQQHTRLFQTIDKHPRLKRDSHNYSEKRGRANFHLTIVPEAPPKK